MAGRGREIFGWGGVEANPFFLTWWGGGGGGEGDLYPLCIPWVPSVSTCYRSYISHTFAFVVRLFLHVQFLKVLNLLG